MNLITCESKTLASLRIIYVKNQNNGTRTIIQEHYRCKFMHLQTLGLPPHIFTYNFDKYMDHLIHGQNYKNLMTKNACEHVKPNLFTN